MERLTRWNKTTEGAELTQYTSEEWKEFMSSLDTVDWVHITNSVNELAEYEDAEEQGLLIKLPCKVGDTVYEPNTLRNIISEYEITEIIINKYGVSFFRWKLKEGIYSSLTGFPVESIGKTIFLTRETAEEVLKF